MEEEKGIEELIAELKQLKIRKATIVVRIEAAAHNKEDKGKTTRPITKRLSKMQSRPYHQTGKKTRHTERRHSVGRRQRTSRNGFESE